jgi:hypothetical protein
VTHLDDALAGVARLALDTAPFIYFIEAHPQDEPVFDEPCKSRGSRCALKRASVDATRSFRPAPMLGNQATVGYVSHSSCAMYVRNAPY